VHPVGFDHPEIVRDFTENAGPALPGCKQGVEHSRADVVEELGHSYRVHLRRDSSDPRLCSEFVTGKGDTGQNDNDRVVQVRQVDGQPVTGHSMANEQGSHVNPRRSHEAKDWGTFDAMDWIWRSSSRMVGSLCIPVWSTDLAAVSRRSKVSEEMAAASPRRNFPERLADVVVRHREGTGKWGPCWWS
jgi:hypothetical protein